MLLSQSWPAEVDLILSALDAANADEAQQRAHPRMTYRTIARLWLFKDDANAEPCELFTRDIAPRGVGFITTHCLPLGYGGEVELVTPSGSALRAACTLLRCRQAARGWFEGALYFNRDQPELGT